MRPDTWDISCLFVSYLRNCIVEILADRSCLEYATCSRNTGVLFAIPFSKSFPENILLESII